MSLSPFHDLPQAWQAAIIEGISMSDGGMNHAIAASYRELKALLMKMELDTSRPTWFQRFFKLGPKPDTEFIKKVMLEYGCFAQGWQAANQKRAWLEGEHLAEDPEIKALREAEGGVI